MTPEQEDAHWALMGKPLMRHWREMCIARREAKRVWQKTLSSQDRIASYDRASGASEKWLAAILNHYGPSCGVDWTGSGCVVSGIEYSYSEVNYD